MSLIVLKPEARRGKYGVVTIMNADGSFNREYRITGDELALVQSSNGVPPGCSKQEWEDIRSYMLGYDFEVGDYAVESDGSLLIKHFEAFVNGRYVEDAVRFEKGEWSETLGVISVDKTILDSKAKPELVSITNGILEVDSTLLVSIS